MLPHWCLRNCCFMAAFCQDHSLWYRRSPFDFNMAGMAMKASKATIISSFPLIVLTQANIGDFTMADNAVFPAILTLISLIFAFLSIRGVDIKDLM